MVVLEGKEQAMDYALILRGTISENEEKNLKFFFHQG